MASEYKVKLNPFTGQLQLVPTNIVLAFKAGVASQASLPLSGNAKGDARIANDTGHLYVWSIEAATGLLTDWADAGDIVDLNWSAISGKPSSSVADIDDAVTKKHTQNTDTILDEGGANEISVEAITKKDIWGVTVYVNPDTGSDESADPSNPATPYATIQAAVNHIPEFMKNASRTIYLQDSLNYTGKTNIKGFGCGRIYIRGFSGNADNVLITIADDAFDVQGTSADVFFDDISIKVTSNGKACIKVSRNSAVRATNCKFGDNGNVGTRGIYCIENSRATAINCSDIDANKVYEGLYVGSGGMIIYKNTTIGDTSTKIKSEGIIADKIDFLQADYEDAITKKHAQNTDQYLDEGGGFEVAVADVARRETSNLNYYIDGTSGNDNNPGTLAEPFETIDKALSMLSSDLHIGTVTIHLRAGTYDVGDSGITFPTDIAVSKKIIFQAYNSESVTLTRTISKDDSFLLKIANFLGHIVINNINFRIYGTNGHAIEVLYSKFVYLYNCDFGDNGETGTVGLFVNYASVSVNELGDIDAAKVAIGIYNQGGALILSSAHSFGDTFSGSYGNNGAILYGNSIDFNQTDYEDAVTKKHTQNADTDLDPTFEDTFVKKVDNVNVLADITSAGADIEDAVTKKHTQGTDTTFATDVIVIDGGNNLNLAPTSGHVLIYRSEVASEFSIYGSDGSERIRMKFSSDDFVIDTISGAQDIIITPGSGFLGINNSNPGEALDVTGNIKCSGTLQIKVYSQDAEPTLSTDETLAMWIDTNDSNRVYLIFRRGSGDQVAVELA